MPQIFEYKTEEEWLALREQDVTSSDISVLFGESPYCTDFEYWHRKKDGTILKFDENERIKWGKRLESPIAAGLAEDNGWEIKPLKVYMRHSTCPRYGSSFDFDIRRTRNGVVQKGLFELKNVDFKEFKAKWLIDSETIEAPVHIELQAQSELEVANSNNPDPYTFIVIGALIGGNKPVVIERDVDRIIGGLMVEKVNAFWKSIDRNIEPLPDFQRDVDIIRALYTDAEGGDVDLSTNNRFAELISQYPVLSSATSNAKKLQDACKAEIASIMKNAAVARCGEAYVTRKTIKKKSYTVAESQYIDLRVKQPKENEK